MSLQVRSVLSMPFAENTYVVWLSGRSDALGHCVSIRAGEPYRVFGGDVLFRGSIGRYDFPGGDGPLLLAGIREKLFTLSDDTIVYPGHGPVTTIGHEKATNPYLAG